MLTWGEISAEAIGISIRHKVIYFGGLTEEDSRGGGDEGQGDY